MSKKNIVLVINHTITDQDLKSYPTLKALDIKVGDVVDVVPFSEYEKVSSELLSAKSELVKATEKYEMAETKNKFSDENLEKVTQEMKDQKDLLLAKDLENSNLKNELSILSFEQDKNADLFHDVIVNHGVNLAGRLYSKEDIESDSEMKDYLLSIKSTAVTAVKSK